jgi:photosystem II stability/assembly factor-like uncharacterized protein
MRRPSPMARSLLACAVIAFGPAAAQPTRASRAPAPAPLAIDTTSYTQLTFRHIGPEGNRVTSVAGVAGDPSVYYAGAASGGIWKSTDGGIHWNPIFDGQPVSSIGSLAVSPSDANVVWAGTGEPFIRSHISAGWGVYRSTDAGKTWAKMGLDNTGRIARIVVHPTNPDIVYVAALGYAYGPQQERGIYRTIDGGKSWERVLFVNDSTGMSDLVMDPNNPRILFAGSWQIEIHTWGRTSGGAGSGIWTSRDGGTTWKRLTGNGLPSKQVGKIGLAMSKANSNRVYALIETGDGVPSWNFPDPDKGRLFRSDDGGENWQLVSSDRQLMGRTAYYSRMGVTPDNENEAYFLTSNWAKTLDGGKTITDPPNRETPGGDHHDIWIDPTNGNRMAVTHDGGFSITTNRGQSWLQVQLPIAQMYHVTTDNRVPYYVYGNRQDGPSARGPSNTKYAVGDSGGIPRGDWRSVGGGESGWATPDPVDSNIVWSSASGFGSVSGIVTKLDLRTGVTQYTELWPEAAIGGSAADAKYRFVWTFPLTISPHDHNTLYVGSQYVHATTNGGKSWQVISPDLTRNEKSHQKASGGLTPDNIGVEYAGVLFAIAESRLERGVIWAGSNDGKVQLTRDGGKTWTDLSANVPGLVEWATISNIEPSRFDKATAYLTVDGHQVNNRDPWIYKTTDYGRTWSAIVNGIPRSPLSYAHVVREDPVRRGLLYAGTENGLYVSFNDGAQWQPLQNNLPHAPVYWLTIQEHFNDLVVATYGRGFWILDDITPLRTLAADVTAKDAHLFASRPAYRFASVEGPFAASYDPVEGQNPKYGASLHYWLKAESKDSVKIDILDAAGATVATMKSQAKAGLNRAWWNLRYDRTKEAKLRVSPIFAPWFAVSAEGTTAPGIQRFAMLVPPGTYTVRLSAAGLTLTQPVDVLKDPNSGGSLEEIRAQTALTRTLSVDIDSTVDMINTVEGVRGQIASLKATLAGDDKTADLRAAADSLEKKYIAMEEELFQVRITGRGQDDVRWPYKLAEQLIYLGQQVTSGDWAPNDQQREVTAVLQQKMRASRVALDKLTNDDLSAFRKRLRDRNVTVLIM